MYPNNRSKWIGEFYQEEITDIADKMYEYAVVKNSTKQEGVKPMIRRKRVNESDSQEKKSVIGLWKDFLKELQNNSSYKELDMGRWYKVFARDDSRCIITMKVISALGLWKVVFQDVDGNTEMFLVGSEDQYWDMQDYWGEKF